MDRAFSWIKALRMIACLFEGYKVFLDEENKFLQVKRCDFTLILFPLSPCEPPTVSGENNDKEICNYLIGCYNRWKSLYEKIRSSGGNYSVVFLVRFERERKRVDDLLAVYDSDAEKLSIPSERCAIDYLSKLFSVPEFGDIAQPVFKAELEVKEENGKLVAENLMSLEFLMENPKRLAEIFERPPQPRDVKENKKNYYKLFVEPYLEFFSDCSKKISVLLEAQKYKEKLHSLGQVKQSHHRLPLDLFRTPIPFFYWKFVKEIEQLKEKIEEFRLKEARFLLVDNTREKKECVENLLKNLGFNGELEFMEPAEFVKNRAEASSYLLVFLDFFLDTKNMLLAPDFMEKFNSSGWFILVSKFPEVFGDYISGARLSTVSSGGILEIGDNPCLGARSILLTFKVAKLINRRLNRLKKMEDEVKKWFFGDSQNTGDCAERMKYLEVEIVNLLNELVSSRSFLATADKKIKLYRLLLELVRHYLYLAEHEWQALVILIDKVKELYKDVYGTSEKFSNSCVLDRIKEGIRHYE